jgi:hypothetical protein
MASYLLRKLRRGGKSDLPHVVRDSLTDAAIRRLEVSIALRVEERPQLRKEVLTALMEELDEDVEAVRHYLLIRGWKKWPQSSTPPSLPAYQWGSKQRRFRSHSRSRISMKSYLTRQNTSSIEPQTHFTYLRTRSKSFIELPWMNHLATAQNSAVLSSRTDT